MCESFQLFKVIGAGDNDEDCTSADGRYTRYCFQKFTVGSRLGVL